MYKEVVVKDPICLKLVASVTRMVVPTDPSAMPPLRRAFVACLGHSQVVHGLAVICAETLWQGNVSECHVSTQLHLGSRTRDYVYQLSTNTLFTWELFPGVPLLLR